MKPLKTSLPMPSLLMTVLSSANSAVRPTSILLVLCILTSCMRTAHRHDDEYLLSHSQPALRAPPGVLIYLDAGHGDHDPGAISPFTQAKEKDLTLQTMLYTAAYLKNFGYAIRMTRNRDTFVELEERAEMANDADPTLFVSIHYNAAPNEEAQGIEVYVFRKQKKAGEPTKAALLAQDVLDQLLLCTNAPSRGVKEANFVVLRRTSMPAILVEGGFLSNKEEAVRLTRPSYIHNIAWGIARGIHDYSVNTYYK